MRGFVQKHTLLVFFPLAFVLSWYPWIIALCSGRTSGPNPLGPLVAGIIVTAIAFGRTGLREFFGRFVRLRVGIKWWAATFLLPILVCLIAVGLTLTVHGWIALQLPADKLRELPERFIFILLFVALGEEPGWRGFALPQLQKSHSPLVASLILAPIWALWHLPLIGNEFPLPIVIPFIVSVFGGTFALTWLFNGTKGSVIFPMLFHATINAVGAGFIFPLFSGPTLLILWWIYGFVWLAIGLGLLCLAGRNQRPHAGQT